jgi:hypothetical protein
MQEFEKERCRKLAPKILEALKKKKFESHFFETIEEARQFVPGLVEKGETVGVGGSVTLRDKLDLVSLLRAQGNTVYDHWDAGQDKIERLRIKRLQSGADVFLSSLNAITCDAPERICAALLIHYKKPGDIDNFTVILVNEEMGF